MTEPKKRKEISEMSKADFKGKKKGFSDVMIVKMNEKDYYVSEKIKGRKPYYKLLVERSKTSTHYKSVEEARVAAESLREKLQAETPDCEVVELVFDDYGKDDLNYDEFLYDNNGRLLGGVTYNGDLRIEFLEDDEPYKYVDKAEYTRRLDEKYESVKEQEFSFFNEGWLEGLRAAKDCAIPFMRYEIFKAEELIKSFSWDEELFAGDVERYNGYIEAMLYAIEVQKECRISSIHYWTVYLCDTRKNATPLTYPPRGAIDGLCEYKIVEREANSSFGESLGGNEFYLVLTDRNKRAINAFDNLGLKGDRPYSMRSFISNAKSGKLSGIIMVEILRQYSLGPGIPDLVINERLIPSLARFAKEYDGTEDE